MTDTPTPRPSDSTAPEAASSAPAAGPQPTYEDLIDLAEAVFNTAVVAKPEQADALRTAVDKLLKPGRGSNADGRDPANAGRVGQGF